MHHTVKTAFAAGILIMMVLALSLPSLAMELKTAAQDSAPKYFVSVNNTMAGICVDIMQAIENSDSKIKFNGYGNFVPFARLQKYLETGRLDVFFGFKKTAERIQKYSFIDVPLYQLNYVVAVRSDDTIDINSFDDVRSLGKNGKLLTVHGTAASSFLFKESELLFEDGARSPAMLLKMLIAKRGRFAFYHDLGLKHAIKMDHLEKEVRILPPSFFKYHHYVAFSKNTPAETVDSVRTALEKITHTGELEKIKAKYQLVN